MEKLRTVKAFQVNEKAVVLNDSGELETLYELIEGNKNFILSWTTEKGKRVSKLVIASDLLTKVKNGEVQLFSEENKGEVKVK